MYKFGMRTAFLRRIVFKYAFALLITICCRHLHGSAQTPYPNDPEISDSLGIPKDSLKFYFPQNSNPDKGFSGKGGLFKENWYSSALYAFKEPILYNYYLKKDIFRFLWLRSFHRPVIFILTRSDDEVTLTTKLLDQQPDFLERRYDPRGWDGLEGSLKGKTIQRFGDSLIIVQADRKAKIVYTHTQPCTVKNWYDFEQLLQKANFWQMSATDEGETGLDGSEWIIEGHLKSNYRFAARWSPKGGFKTAGIFLIKLSGLEESIY